MALGPHEKNVNKAVEHHTFAANLGHTKSKYHVGQYLLYAKVNRHKTKALTSMPSPPA